jgi:hypothetical protein
VNGQTFTVQFPLRGNYKLVCLVHENMTGTVHVMEPAANRGVVRGRRMRFDRAPVFRIGPRLMRAEIAKE